MSTSVPSRFCPMCDMRTDEDLCPTDRVPTVRTDFDRADLADDAIGNVVAGRYRVERLLGKGGAGRVYAARQIETDRLVALKLLLPHHARDRVHVKRFYREARAATRLAGAHVVSVLDFGVDDETRTPFIAMELLSGRTLRELIAEGPVAPRVAAGLGAQIAQALVEAKRAGIVHRDLKPANIMCVVDDGDGVPLLKVMDFGIAKDLDSRDTDTLTAQGVAVGTPAYMAPEQVSGGEVGHKADLYALGCLLYELITGEPPFSSEARAELYVDHLLKPAPPLPARAPGGEVPPELVALVGELLAKKAEERPDSTEGVAARLMHIAGADGASATTRRRRARLWALAVTAASVLAGTGVVLLAGGGESPPAATAAPVPGDEEAVAAPSDGAQEHLVIRGSMATIRLHPGQPQATMQVAGDPARVTREIEGTRLTLTIAAPVQTDEQLVIDLFGSRWKTIKVTGLATVESTVPLEAEDLSLGLAGSARARLQVEGASLTTSLRGSSDIVLTGRVQHHEIRAGGASRLDARQLVSEETSLAASGSAEVTVYAETRLDARNEGTGEVLYYGEPAEVMRGGNDIRPGD